MTDQTVDIRVLTELNIEIGSREAQTDVPFFERHLAPAFAMRRANDSRDTIDRGGYLKALGQATRKDRETRVESVAIVGEERAVVTCIVSMDGRAYHNLRIFVRNVPRRNGDPAWLLLAWVNEPIAEH